MPDLWDNGGKKIRKWFYWFRWAHPAHFCNHTANHDHTYKNSILCVCVRFVHTQARMSIHTRLFHNILLLSTAIKQNRWKGEKIEAEKTVMLPMPLTRNV